MTVTEQRLSIKQQQEVVNERTVLDNLVKRFLEFFFGTPEEPAQPVASADARVDNFRKSMPLVAFKIAETLAVGVDYIQKRVRDAISGGSNNGGKGNNRTESNRNDGKSNIDVRRRAGSKRAAKPANTSATNLST